MKVDIVVSDAVIGHFARKKKDKYIISKGQQLAAHFFCLHPNVNSITPSFFHKISKSWYQMVGN
jgi:hypothetical protein